MHNRDEDLVTRYVTPGMRYLQLLSHVMKLGPNRTAFGRALAADARQVTDGELDRLLDGDWRAQLAAAWLIGLTHRVQYRQRLGELLLASRLANAGQGFCFALVRFGTHQDTRLLAEYLDRYLPRLDLRYDQQWALGALIHLDAWLGTRESDRFLDGPWQRWAQAQHATDMTPEILRTITRGVCVFADECMGLQAERDTPT